MLLLLRFLKIVAVSSLFAGTTGAFAARDLRDRRLFAYAFAGPGFGASWACGFGLAAFEEVPLLSGWILGSLALSLLSLHFVLYAVGKEGRRNAWTASLALAPLLATIALMVFKP